MNNMGIDFVDFGDTSTPSIASTSLNDYGEKKSGVPVSNPKEDSSLNDFGEKKSGVPVVNPKEDDGISFSDLSDASEEEFIVEKKPKKKESNKREVTGGRKYVKGNNKTKKYQIAKKLFTYYTGLKMQNKNSEEIKKSLTYEIMRNSLDREIVSQSALTVQSVYEDLRTIDDETANDIAQKIKIAMSDKNNSNYAALTRLSIMNYQQLEVERVHLNNHLRDVQLQLKMILYQEHLLNDPKTISVELSQMLFRIVADTFC